jgi:hypothetical protein
VELAKKNLPLAEAAMKEAEAFLESETWSDAAARQREARRLLEEILKKLQEQGDDKDQQQQPEPQPSQEISPEELDRLARAVEERSQRLQDERRKPKRPTPVEEDW